jgi:predicted transcriptional regulator
MRRSKLEMYIDILKVLCQRGPLKLTHIMYKANLNCSILIQYLDFLNKQGLIEERIVGRNTVVYACTARGIRVLKSFREINQSLPIIEGEDKNLPPAY